MSRLTDSPRINSFFGRHYLKGFSTAIVPTESLDDAILWHLYFSEDGSRLPYPDLDSQESASIDLGNLVKGRHILGWCSEANLHAGAPDMNYAVRPSQLKGPGKDFALEKISFSVGELVTGGCQFSIGRKDSPIRITRAGYIAKLRWIRQKYFTLWDVEENRGWLVDGISALLHLLRTSLEFSRTDKFSPEFLFDRTKFEESTSPLRPDAALEVLMNRTNRALDLYPKDEKTETERRLQDRAEELYEVLEKLIDHKAMAEAAYKGLNVKPRVRDRLEGWDFTEIAADRDPFHLKTTTLPLNLLSWVDFTRAIPSVTLFGRGFGDIIRASCMPHPMPADSQGPCRNWTTVPKDEYYLCVAVADLHDIIDQLGGDLSTHPVTVTPSIKWRNSFCGNPFEECVCARPIPTPGDGKRKGRQDSSKSTQPIHPIQELVPDTMNFLFSETTAIDLETHKGGAVIFGTPRWKWPGLSSTTNSKTRPSLGKRNTSEVTTAQSFSSMDAASSLDTTAASVALSDSMMGGPASNNAAASSPPTSLSSGSQTPPMDASGSGVLSSEMEGVSVNEVTASQEGRRGKKKRGWFSQGSGVDSDDMSEDRGSGKRRKLIGKAKAALKHIGG
ncbi:hypothetical protein B0T25DRAFT_460196 [Lasiosphaeria hispida]|uniref:Uncharacterized protein n=1 Tax=Lasiosphaeria hispida TaxID=260671 RepID=A0AAJ0HB64_9PEZI|nr:hypothetical protein B0T25DRAFT_460196 [Lasiosphaeria hispida]